jgi:penicillin-binding protein 1A
MGAVLVNAVSPPGLPPPPPRVVVMNRADGGVLYWIGKLYGFAALVTIAVSAFTCFLVYSYFSLKAPPVPDLSRYSTIAPAISRMYAADGTMLGEFANEWRELVPYERMPQRLIDAFVAVEDHNFFQHRGLYYRGILRALWANITAGDFAQGGSTITQQVAKQLVLTSEKSLTRKGLEAITARRLEARYSKKAILSVYLNHIYLGAGAYGVGAAAHRYFQKDLDHLTLAEAALIAGLAQAPSSYSPVHRPKLAIERRNVVLDKMAEYGLASAADVATAKKEPIRLNLYRDTFPQRMPYYAKYVQRYVTDRYGNDALFTNGLRVEAAAEPTWEAGAYENTEFGARHQDKRQGWRGPEWRIDGAARELFLGRQRELYGNAPLEPGARYLALVDKVTKDRAEVLVGDRRFTLPLRNMRWASKWVPGNADNDIPIENVKDALKPGFVIWVSREIRSRGRHRVWHLPDGRNPAWLASDDQQAWDASHTDVVQLEQVPHPQAAIFTADHRSGHVVAMVGGSDYDRSEYNRVMNRDACRQPGSTYKPIYYALGLDQGYGFDTILNDVPTKIIDPLTGEEWVPTNLGDTLDGDVTLEYALVFSKNIPSVDLFQRLGAKNVEAWARRLGFTTKIFADDALALGASCTYMDEMARAFSVFARNGQWWPRPKGSESSWVFVRRIIGRDGKLLEDNTLPSDPQLTAGHRFDRMAALAGINAPQAIPARAAYLMSKLLANEVTYGFATVLRQTNIKAAGKTGTSSDTHDTWFIAYTSQFTTVVWMGDDKKQRALGKNDAAYITVVPLWSRYMYEEAKAYPNPSIPWITPRGISPNDRGEHSKGKKGEPMDLIYRSSKRDKAPEDDRPPV